jgi:WD40 repeat protein
MVAGTSAGSIFLWAVENGHVVRTFRDPGRREFHLAWSPDGAHLVSQSLDDQDLWVWSIDDEMVIGTMVGHTSAVTSLAWSPDGAQLVTGSDNGVLRLWQVDEGQIALAIRQQLRFISSVAWSPKGTQVADAGGFVSGEECVECTVRLWSSEGELLQTLEHSGPVNSIAYSPDGDRLATGSGVFLVAGCLDCVLRIWSTSDGQLLRTIEHPEEVLSVAWSPDGTLATGSEVARIWSPDDGQLLETLHATTVGGVHSLAFSPDGARLAGTTGSAHIWSVDDSRLLLVFRPSEGVGPLAWSADGTLLATANLGSVKVFSSDDGSLVQQLVQRLAMPYRAVAWQPGGGCSFASGSVSGAVQVWGPSP